MTAGLFFVRKVKKSETRTPWNSSIGNIPCISSRRNRNKRRWGTVVFGSNLKFCVAYLFRISLFAHRRYITDGAYHFAMCPRRDVFKNQFSYYRSNTHIISTIFGISSCKIHP